MFKDELGSKIMTEFCALSAKAYAYKLDDDTEMKKPKGTKKCIVKREIPFKNYADAFFNTDVCKTEDIDISKTEDIGISKTEDKDEGTVRDMLIRVFRYSKQWRGKKKKR